MTNTHEQLARKFVKYVILTHVYRFGDTTIYPCEGRYPNVPNSSKCKTNQGPLVAPGPASSIPHVSLENAPILYILTRVCGTNCIKLSVKKKTKRNWGRKIEKSSVSKAGVEIIDFFICLSLLLPIWTLSILTEETPTFIFSSLSKNSLSNRLFTSTTEFRLLEIMNSSRPVNVVPLKETVCSEAV